MLRQKYLWIFIGVFAIACFAYSFLLSTPEMYSRLNVDPAESNGAAFPLFMLPFYSNMVGPLFLSFLTALTINEQWQTGMLRQPLLHGYTRRQILYSKLFVLSMTACFNVIAVFVVSYGFGWMRWGLEVFSSPQFENSVKVYLLVAAALLVTQVLTVTVAFFTKRTLYTVVVMVAIIFGDSMINNAFPQLSVRFNYAYYPYHYLIGSKFEGVLSGVSSVTGLILVVVWLLGLYLIVRKRIDTMDFTV